MGAVTRIKSSRKQWTCDKCGKTINIGDSYLRGEVNFGPVFVRCTSCGLEHWEVTSSPYKAQAGRIVYKWHEDFELDESTPTTLSETLEPIRDELQEKLDNMPEGLQDSEVGLRLQDQIDGLERAIDDLELIDLDDIKQTVVDDFITQLEDEFEDEDYETIIQSDKLAPEVKEDMVSAFYENLSSEISEALESIEL